MSTGVQNTEVVNAQLPLTTPWIVKLFSGLIVGAAFGFTGFYSVVCSFVLAVLWLFSSLGGRVSDNFLYFFLYSLAVFIVVLVTCIYLAIFRKFYFFKGALAGLLIASLGPAVFLFCRINLDHALAYSFLVFIIMSLWLVDNVGSGEFKKVVAYFVILVIGIPISLYLAQTLMNTLAPSVYEWLQWSPPRNPVDLLSFIFPTTFLTRLGH